jgi:hypothetical protein
LRMMQYKRLGWHGLVLRVPWDWEITSESGGRRDAYFRMDDPTQSRMEAKWERIEKRNVPLTLILDNMIEKLKKERRQLKKAKVLSRGSSKICGHTGAYILWQSDMKALATSWYCDEAERLCLIQLFFKPEEEKASVELFESILKSTICHSDEEMVLWTVLDVQFEVPRNLVLESRKLLVGRANMFFSSKDLSLLVDWHGFATGLLEKYGSLRKWSDSKVTQDVSKALKLKLPSAQEGGGEEGPLSYRTSQKGLVGGSAIVLGRVWNDLELNKIFSVFMKCGDKVVDPEKAFESIIGSFKKVSPVPGVG